MSLGQERNTDTDVIIEAFRSFIELCNSSDWLLNGERNQIRDCIVSAREVERMWEELESNDASDYFESVLKLNCPDFHESSGLCKACDIILGKILTAPAIPSVNVKYFLEDYVELCGADRFANVLSASILQSEVYRVVLDYIASASHKEKMGISLEARILSSVWQHDRQLQNNETLWQNWLKDDTSGHSIAVALSIIADPHTTNDLASKFISLFITALQKRNDLAVRFWEVILADSAMTCILAKFDNLLEAIFDFLRISGQWMEATETMDWLSREAGPCQKLGFSSIVAALESFLKTESDVLHQSTKTFLSQRRNCQGCTLWDDVHMKIAHCLLMEQPEV